MKRVPLRRRALAAAMGAYQHLDRPAAPAQPSRPKYYTPPSGSPLQALPDDVLRRLLAGVPFLDHGATAAACRAFRAVINGPQFLALRRRFGFVEHEIVIVGGSAFVGEELKIRTAHTSGVRLSINDGEGCLKISSRGVLYSDSTTDGGTRLFVCVEKVGWESQMYVYAVDVSSGSVSCLTTIPMRRSLHSFEWHGGCLYFAGGFRPPLSATDFLHSFQVFNVATGLWGDLPPMPQVFTLAASGVIGNQLFVAGGRAHEDFIDMNNSLSTLQIFDFTTRTWRLGAPMPTARTESIGVVVDGKLFVITSGADTMLVYDPQSDTWAIESDIPYADSAVGHACAHNGRVIVFLTSGEAFERAAAGTWSAYDLADEARDIVGRFESISSWLGPSAYEFVAQSVLLG